MTDPTATAQQLTEDADWDAIATWCGGRLINHRDPSDEYETELRIGDGKETLYGYEDDWVIRTGAGFQILPACAYQPTAEETP